MPSRARGHGTRRGSPRLGFGALRRIAYAGGASQPGAGKERPLPSGAGVLAARALDVGRPRLLRPSLEPSGGGGLSRGRGRGSRREERFGRLGALCARDVRIGGGVGGHGLVPAGGCPRGESRLLLGERRRRPWGIRAGCWLRRPEILVGGLGARGLARVGAGSRHTAGMMAGAACVRIELRPAGHPTALHVLEPPVCIGARLLVIVPPLPRLLGGRSRVARIALRTGRRAALEALRARSEVRLGRGRFRGGGSGRGPSRRGFRLGRAVELPVAGA